MVDLVVEVEGGQLPLVLMVIPVDQVIILRQVLLKETMVVLVVEQVHLLLELLDLVFTMLVAAVVELAVQDLILHLLQAQVLLDQRLMEDDVFQQLQADLVHQMISQDQV
jgi:hypothetical protein